MTGPALGVRGLQGSLRLEAAPRAAEVAEGPGGLADFFLTVESGCLFLSPAGLALLLPASIPIKIERFSAERLHGKVRLGGLQVPITVQPGVSRSGRLILTLVGMAGMVMGMVGGPLRERLSEAPGVHLSGGNQLELDLMELLRPLKIEVPPLRGVEVRPEGAELFF